MAVTLHYTVDQFVRERVGKHSDDRRVPREVAEDQLREFIEILLDCLEVGIETEFPRGSGTFYTKLSDEVFDVRIEL